MVLPDARRRFDGLAEPIALQAHLERLGDVSTSTARAREVIDLRDQFLW